VISNAYEEEDEGIIAFRKKLPKDQAIGQNIYDEAGRHGNY
jgi:hypothetical protein